MTSNVLTRKATTSKLSCTQLRRSGGTLVAVLVILAIVGMLAAHTLQTLVLIRQSESKRAVVRQLQEIVQLARHTAESKTIQTSSETMHEIQVEVQPSKLAGITIQMAESSQIAESSGGDQLRDYRVVVQYPVDQHTDSAVKSPSVQPWTSSWQTRGWDAKTDKTDD